MQHFTKSKKKKVLVRVYVEHFHVAYFDGEMLKRKAERCFFSKATLGRENICKVGMWEKNSGKMC